MAALLRDRGLRNMIHGHVRALLLRVVERDVVVALCSVRRCGTTVIVAVSSIKTGKSERKKTIWGDYTESSAPVMRICHCPSPSQRTQTLALGCGSLLYRSCGTGRTGRILLHRV